MSEISQTSKITAPALSINVGEIQWPIERVKEILASKNQQLEELQQKLDTAIETESEDVGLLTLQVASAKARIKEFNDPLKARHGYNLTQTTTDSN